MTGEKLFMPTPLFNIYQTTLVSLIICQTLFLQCSKNHILEPGQVSVHVTATGGGRVNVSFSDTVVDAGSKITLAAVADTQSVFLGWFGSLRSTMDSLTIVVTENMIIEAQFSPAPQGGQMAQVPSKTKSFTMGSASAAASPEEKPAHAVTFSYAFYIDKNETTQSRYRQLMGANPSQARALGSAYGVGDSFPVSYVTWYEAALFCNARSRSEGYDTVYSFTAVCRDDQQCPYVLENLSIHYDRFGYRLPTEAEWEFACRAGTSTDYSWGANYPDTGGTGDHAWFVDNAGDSVHRVGLKKPNALGVFDMEGNVAEWVDDWLGAYSNTACIDPIGPTNRPFQTFEDSLQRPVRGGTYNLGSLFLRSSCRKGPYDTPAKIYDKSIGFRCVLGAFFPDTSKIFQTTQLDTSGIITCNPSDLIAFFGTSNIKCVFVKEIGGNRTNSYCYVDFSEPEKPVHVIADLQPPCNPVISPNGKFVAYSSKGEAGFSGPSTGTIRLLNASGGSPQRSPPSQPMYIPRWWVDPNTGDTFVVYSDNTLPDDFPSWKTGRTLRQHIINGAFSGTAEVLCDTGSFYGGLSYDGNFLATGFRNAYMLNLKANDLYYYFAPTKNGTSGPIQVCNVSITPSYDRQDELMFLDYGCPTVSSIVGKPYGLHSIIFTSTSSDSIGWYEKPEWFDKWEDAEWSNHPRFAAAVAQANAIAGQGTIMGIDLQTRAYCTIAAGADLRDPYLWIDPQYVSQKPDPFHNFAKYDVPGQLSGGQMPLCMKLKLFWTEIPELQCVIVGGSPTYYGIDPAFITIVKALNMATIASSSFTSYTIASNYVLPQISNLKILIMGLDPYAMAYNQKDPYLNGLPRTLGYQLDQSNNFWKSGLPQAVREKITAFDSSQWSGYYSTGFTKETRTGGWGLPQIDGGDYQFEDSAIQANVVLFKYLADTLLLRGAHLLVVNFPENPLYRQTSMIGRLGPSRATYAQLSSWLRTLEQQNAFFHFYDANNGGDHDYTDAEALDCNHLNYLGARKLAGRIDSLCRIYLK